MAQSFPSPCREVSKCYKYLNVISEGVYGVVHRAQCLSSGDIVALKKIKIGKSRSGFPQSSLREIMILSQLSHENIVSIREVVVDDSECVVDVFMVMEYAANDLQSIMHHKNWQIWSLADCKSLLFQILNGVNYLHSHNLIHRDLKTSNLLLSNDGALKICDFGMSRECDEKMTNYVVTLWYRSIELLLGADVYTKAIDLWSIGCIFAELLTGKVLFCGHGEFEQMNLIFTLLGTESLSNQNYAHQSMIKPKKSTFDEKFTEQKYTKETRNLLRDFFIFDPAKRISAESALKHPFFSDELPNMTKAENMPKFKEHHLEQRRKEKRPTDQGTANNKDNDDQSA